MQSEHKKILSLGDASQFKYLTEVSTSIQVYYAVERRVLVTLLYLLMYSVNV